MQNKIRESNFETECSKLVLDYIDYGNAFATVIYENRTMQKEDGEAVLQYAGPRLIRISPEDVVFNPMATSFQDSYKVVRSTTTLGELIKRSKTNPQDSYLQTIVEHRRKLRALVAGYNKDDWAKASQYSIDGFGSLYE